MTIRRAALRAALTVGLLIAPFAGYGQQPQVKSWRIGYLDGSSPSARTTLMEAFKRQLRDLGYGPSQYVIDARWAEGYDDRLPSLANDLVRDKPDAIFTVAPLSAIAAARATKAIPVIFVGVGNPVGTGLLPSLARPPANVTGVTLLAIELAPKRLEVLKRAVPGAMKVGILWNPANPVNERELKEARAAAGALGVTLIAVEFRSPEELEEAFVATTRHHPDAVFLLSSPVTFLNRPRIADFTLKHRLPMVCALREYAVSGCLMSYGPSYADHFRRAAVYVDKILSSSRPSPSWSSTSRPPERSA
jgi:putative tryptophan/tyrosine transport system substrate-binding protein